MWEWHWEVILPSVQALPVLWHKGAGPAFTVIRMWMCLNTYRAGVMETEEDEMYEARNFPLICWCLSLNVGLIQRLACREVNLGCWWWDSRSSGKGKWNGKEGRKFKDATVLWLRLKVAGVLSYMGPSEKPWNALKMCFNTRVGISSHGR